MHKMQTKQDQPKTSSLHFFTQQVSRVTDIPRATIYLSHPERQEQVPDVLVIGQRNKILFVGAASLEISRLLEVETHDPVGQAESKRFLSFLKTFRKEVIAQALQTKTGLKTSIQFRNHTLALRGFLMYGLSQNKMDTMVMVEIRCQKRIDPDSQKTPYALTSREMTILKHMKDGLTNKEIACKLEIGLYTVKAHVKHIMNKMDIRTRAGIVGKYLEV